MSDMQYTTPPLPPTPAPKKDNKLQIVAASFFGLAVVVLILAVALPSSNSDSNTTSATDAPAPVITAAPVNKYDSYYQHVLNNSGQANSMAKSKVIEFGDLVCQALDEGNSVAQVVNVVSSAVGSTSDLELGAAVIFAAVKYICPEYQAMMDAYLD